MEEEYEEVVWIAGEKKLRTPIQVEGSTQILQQVRREAPGRCSNVSDVCLTLGQKWDADADMIRTS